ncbi:MAG: T9SS type A sorting domain-containing protein [bacterium]
MHHYLYDSPWAESENPNYVKDNIANYICNLEYYQAADTGFICSIQSGRWITDLQPLHITKIPTQTQFLYNVNMALLYGAKGIDVNDYYYFMNGDTTRRTGMVGVYDTSYTGNFVKYYTPIWYTLHDEISPRLKGSYGKTLKKITQSAQDYFQNNMSTFSVGGALFYKNINWEFDCGTFYPPTGEEDKKYVMAVSRYYNNTSEIADTNNSTKSPIQPSFYMGCTVGSSVNYKIYDHYSGVTDYAFRTAESELYVAKTIMPGEAALLEIMPAVKYGGYIQSSETINTSTTLFDNLTVTPNNTLIITGTNIIYTLKDTLALNTDAVINCTNGGKINGRYGNILFNGTGKIIFDNWNQSLFFANENGHPKLIWGALTGNQTYVIYRKLGSTFSFDSIGVVNSTDANLQQCFVDITANINLGVLAGHNIWYKIKKINGQNVQYTNQISVEVQGQAIDKAAVSAADFAIEQNYPNPFNASTQIRYSIPQTGKVTIKLYDILGKEVKNLYDGMKESGSYELNIDCNDLASGIYIYRVQYNDNVLSKKMMLLK